MPEDRSRLKPRIGFAPSDEKTIFNLANRQFGIYSGARAWRPKRG